MINFLKETAILPTLIKFDSNTKNNESFDLIYNPLNKEYNIVYEERGVDSVMYKTSNIVFAISYYIDTLRKYKIIR